MYPDFNPPTAAKIRPLLSAPPSTPTRAARCPWISPNISPPQSPPNRPKTSAEKSALLADLRMLDPHQSGTGKINAAGVNIAEVSVVKIGKQL